MYASGASFDFSAGAGVPVSAAEAADCLAEIIEASGYVRPAPGANGFSGASDCCYTYTAIIKQTAPDASMLLATTTAGPMMIYASTIAVPLNPPGVPAGLVWKEFWKKVGAWLAKRGVACGALALADGPLPIGDILAIGLGLWTLYELLEHWDELWEAASAIAATVFMAQKKKKKAIGIFEQLNIHLARLLREAVNGKQPDHQGNPEGYDDAHWLAEILNFINQLKALGFSERQIRRFIEGKWGSEKMNLVLRAIQQLAERLGIEIPPFFG